MDTQLHSVGIRVERKQLTLDLRENPQGRFLRVTEDVNGRYNAIIVPATGLELFRDTLNEVIKSIATSPPGLMTPLGWPREPGNTDASHRQSARP